MRGRELVASLGERKAGGRDLKLVYRRTRLVGERLVASLEEIRAKGWETCSYSTEEKFWRERDW